MSDNAGTTVPAPSAVVAWFSTAGAAASAIDSYASLTLATVTFDTEALQKTADQMTPEDKEAVQPAIDCLAEANTALATAKDHALAWQGTARAAMIDVTSDIQGVSSEINGYLSTIMQARAKLGTQPTDAQVIAYMTSACEQLTLVRGSLPGFQTSSSDFSTQMISIEENFSTDNTNFKTDATTIATLAGPQSGLITTLTTEIEACHASIKRDIGLIIGGVATTLAGVGLVLVGVLVDVSTLGFGSAPAAGLIVGGFVVAAGGIAMTTLSGNDLAQQEKNLARYTAELTLLQAAQASFATTTTVLNNLATSAAESRQSANTLASSWQLLDGELRTTITTVNQAITDGSTGPLEQLDTLVDSISTDWGHASDTADAIQQLLTGMSVPTTTTSPVAPRAAA